MSMSECMASDPEQVRAAVEKWLAEYDLVEDFAAGVEDILPPPSIDPDITVEDIIEQW